MKHRKYWEVPGRRRNSQTLTATPTSTLTRHSLQMETNLTNLGITSNMPLASKNPSLHPSTASSVLQPSLPLLTLDQSTPSPATFAKGQTLELRSTTEQEHSKAACYQEARCQCNPPSRTTTEAPTKASWARSLSSRVLPKPASGHALLQPAQPTLYQV